MWPFLRRDYSKYVGESVVYFLGGLSEEAEVAGMDYDIGLTLVSKDLPDRYMWCALGKMAPQWKEWSTGPKYKRKYHKLYRKWFRAAVKMIRKGEIDTAELMRLSEESGIELDSRPDQRSCAFGQ